MVYSLIYARQVLICLQSPSYSINGSALLAMASMVVHLGLWNFRTVFKFKQHLLLSISLNNAMMVVVRNSLLTNHANTCKNGGKTSLQDTTISSQNYYHCIVGTIYGF